LQNYLNAIIAVSGGEIRYCELYTFTLVSGQVYRLTTWDQDITYNGNVYHSNAAAGGPFVVCGSVKVAIGLDVNTTTLKFFCEPSVQINSIPMLAAIKLGFFDGATVTIRRYFLDCVGGDPTCEKFTGLWGEVTDLGRAGLSVTVASMTEYLNQPFPAYVYGPGCRHTYGGINCGVTLSPISGSITSTSTAITLNTSLSPAGVLAPPSSAPSLGSTSGNTQLPARQYYVVVTYTYSGGETTASPEASISVPAGKVLTVASPASVTGATGWNVYVGTGPGTELLQSNIPISIGTGYTEPLTGITQGNAVPPQASSLGFYAQGIITFTSGANSGLSASIKGNTGGVLTLDIPLLSAPAIADTFVATGGCVKTFQACVANQGSISTAQIRFGGEPNIPSPELGL
jgi:hypothetical protein